MCQPPDARTPSERTSLPSGNTAQAASPNNTHVDARNQSHPRAIPNTRTHQRRMRPRCTQRLTPALVSGSWVQCAKFRFGGILTPALSPPSDGTERGKRSQRLWKDLRLVGQDGQLDRQIMESEGGSTHRTQPPPKLAVHPAPETDLGAAEISQLHLCNADANIRHAFKGLFGRRQRH